MVADGDDVALNGRVGRVCGVAAGHEPLIKIPRRSVLTGGSEVNWVSETAVVHGESRRRWNRSKVPSCRPPFQE